MSAALLDAIVALDLLTLRDAEGAPLDAASWRAGVARSLAGGERACVWRDGALRAYALLQPRPELGDPGDWFVSGFNSHPQWRSPGLFRALFAQLQAVLQARGIRRLHSHVYKHNAASLALHRRLGFRVVNENARALAFVAEVDGLRWPVRPR